MGFRNIGEVIAGYIATRPSGRRIVIDGTREPADEILFYTGQPDEVAPGKISLYAAGPGSAGLYIEAPRVAGGPEDPTYILLTHGEFSTAVDVVSRGAVNVSSEGAATLVSNGGDVAVSCGPESAITLVGEVIGSSRYAVAETPDPRSNTAAPADDLELTLPLAAGARYEVEMWVYFQTAVNCDIRTDWQVPAGSTGLKGALGATEASGDYTSRLNTRVRIGGHLHPSDVGYQLETGAADQLCYERGVVTTTDAGDITFRWAQFTATVGNLTRDAGSYMKVTRIA